jgi:hypothetical protein
MENHPMTETPEIRRPRKMARDAYVASSDSASAATATNAPSSAEMAAPAVAKPQTKAGLVVDLLGREEGASLTELSEATGWLPHTCRAFLTGLRKRGQSPEKGKRDDGVTFYHLRPVEVAA